MEAIASIISTFGFPIACVVALGYVGYKYINRIMDENKEREKNYQTMLASYGEKMAEIAQALAEIKKDIGNIRAQ